MRAQEQVKTLRSQRDNTFSEREKLRGEILKGLSASIPLERTKSTKPPEDGVVFSFRDGKQYPAADLLSWKLG